MKTEENIPMRNYSQRSNSLHEFNFIVDNTPIHVKLGKMPLVEVAGQTIFSDSDLENGEWCKQLKRGELPDHVSKKITDEIRKTNGKDVNFDEVNKAYAESVTSEKMKAAKDKQATGRNNNKKEEGEPKVLYKARFNYDDYHYDEFADHGVLRFLKYQDGQTEVVMNVEIPDPDDPEKTITVMPAPQIAQTKRDRALQEEQNDAIKFPPAPIDYISEYDLYCEIKAFIHTFMELKPEDEIILSLYVMKASIFDALKDTSFPFIHVLAPYGKGKSRLLTVLRFTPSFSDMTDFFMPFFSISKPCLLFHSRIYDLSLDPCLSFPTAIIIIWKRGIWILL